MVIVGLLAAIAIPQIGKFRERAYVTSLKNDARILVNEAEGVYTDTGSYPATQAILVANVALSTGNTVGAYSVAANDAGVNFTITNARTGKTLAVANSKLGNVTG